MERISKYLISTRIKNTWPKNKKSHLIFSSIAALDKYPKNNFSFKKFDINKKYWNNSSKNKRDFKYLDSLYEKSLHKFVFFLNKYHNTNYSKRFWRILIGPWLGQFLFVLFDRWQNISSSLKRYNIDKVKVLKLDNEIVVPYESEDFIKFTQNDLWNQFIYQNTYEYLIQKKKIENIQFNFKKRLDEDVDFFRHKPDKISNLNKLIFKFFSFFNTKNFKYLIYRSYLGSINELKLAIKLKQLPTFNLDKNKFITNKKIDKNTRYKIKNIFDPKNKFEKFLLNSFIYHLPKIFLENFEDLKNFSAKSNLPQKPKKIMTSSALWYDSFFSYHVAKLSEHGTKIIYGQHGGAYGITSYSWPELHEKKIADKYLTWGWKGNKSEKQIKSFYILTKKNSYNWQQEKKDLLFLLKHRKIYVQSPESQACFDIYSEYIKFCYNFLNKLDNKIKKRVILRTKYKNFKVDSVDYYSNLKNNFKFDSSNKFNEACQSARLVINTTNSTTFCQTFSSDVPSVLILNKKNNPFRKSATKVINLLEKNNLIFFNDKKAAKFINFLWDKNIYNWWFDKNTQKALNEFKINFANPSKNIVNSILDQLVLKD